MRKALTHLSLALAALAAAHSPARAGCVRDVAEIRGMREHKVFGVGLVVGLRGTGDRGRETQRRISMLLQRLNFTVDPTDLPSKNVALVFVTARIRSDTPKGTCIGVTVSSMGDATSLAGGELLPTPLHADDAETVYARAQGTVSVSAGGHQTAGSIASGATVEKEIPSGALDRYYLSAAGERVYYLDIVLAENQGGFDLADEIATAVNTGLRASSEEPAARALSATQVRVEIPQGYQDRRVAFAHEILNTPVVVDPPATVVINERTGVIVHTGNVRFSSADVQVGSTRVHIGKEGTLDELKVAVNRLYVDQASAVDLIAVIKELARAGALQARWVIR